MLLSLEQVGSFLGLSHNPTRELVTSGEIPSTIVGGRYRVTVAALAWYLVDQAEGTEGFKKQLSAASSRVALRKRLHEEYETEIRKFLKAK